MATAANPAIMVSPSVAPKTESREKLNRVIEQRSALIKQATIALAGDHGLTEEQVDELERGVKQLRINVLRLMKRLRSIGPDPRRPRSRQRIDRDLLNYDITIMQAEIELCEPDLEETEEQGFLYDKWTAETHRERLLKKLAELKDE
jgi:hypothetical protein